MAIHNEVIQNGWLVYKPIIQKDAEGNYKKGLCILKTMRGKRSIGDKIRGIYYDTPVIQSKNPEDIKKMEQWDAGDIIELKGFLASREVKKARRCTYCNNKLSTPGVQMYIQPIFMTRREQGVDEVEARNRLNELCEISNKIFAIGNLTKDPVMGKTNKGVSNTAYQLAIDRKFRVREDSVEERTDFPWVKTYGAQAELDNESLTTGAVVMVDGALRVRSDYPRSDKCPICGETFVWKDTTMEIVPYSVEYLRNFKTPENLEEDAIATLGLAQGNAEEPEE